MFHNPASPASASVSTRAFPHPAGACEAKKNEAALPEIKEDTADGYVREDQMHPAPSPDSSSSEPTPFLKWQAANAPFVRLIHDQGRIFHADRREHGMSTATISSTLSRLDEKVQMANNLKSARKINAMKNGFPDEKTYNKHMYKKAVDRARLQSSGGASNVPGCADTTNAGLDPEKNPATNTCNFSEMDGKMWHRDCNKVNRNLRALRLGFPDESAYNRYLYRQCAFREGFVLQDGQADIAGYSRFKAERNMRNAGFVLEDGTLDKVAFNRCSLERTAMSAGFVSRNGVIDVKGYQRHSFEKMVRKARYVNSDGTIDARAYRSEAPARAAKKAGFLHPDGTADVAAYRLQRMKQTRTRLNEQATAERNVMIATASDAWPESFTVPLPAEWPASLGAGTQAMADLPDTVVDSGFFPV